MRYGEWHDVPYHSMCGADGTALTDLYTANTLIPTPMQWRSPHMRHTSPEAILKSLYTVYWVHMAPLLEDLM